MHRTSLPGDQSEYWSRVAAEKEFGHPLRFELLGPHVRPEHRILDLGCGYGRLVAELRDRGFPNVIGADSATGMIERGRAERPDLDLRVLEGRGLPWDDGTFDVVLLFSVLTCVPRPEDQDSLLREIERVLGSRGILHVSDLLLQEDERNQARYVAGEARFGTRGVFELPEGVVVAHFPRLRIAELTRGFRELAFEELDVVTMNGHRARAFQYLGRREG